MTKEVLLAIEEQNETLSMIYDEMNKMHSELIDLRTKAKELEQENSSLKDEVITSTTNGAVISKLMEICSKREQTMLTMIWSLSTIPNVVEKLAENQTFIDLIVELLHTEVIQSVIKPTLGIVANMCYHKTTRLAIGSKVAPLILGIDAEDSTQKILATVVMNLTLEELIVTKMIDSGMLFEKLEDFMKSKVCFSFAERALSNTLKVLRQSGRTNEFIDFLVNIAKTYPINKEMKREIGSIASGFE